MREKWARRIVYITGILIFMLSAFFARLQNPDEGIDRATETNRLSHELIDPDKISHGQSIYQQQNCSLCHSVQGSGNPRYPLDGVGQKHSTTELAYWVIGDEKIKDQLSDRNFNYKQIHRKLANAELDALIIYLQSL